jgi:hypothetical protein
MLHFSLLDAVDQEMPSVLRWHKIWRVRRDPRAYYGKAINPDISDEGNGRRYLERNMSLEKNVALYEEIFYTLAGDGVLAKRSTSSRSEDVLGDLDSHGT